MSLLDGLLNISRPGGPAGGDLEQEFPEPHVVAVHTGGGTRLLIGDIDDGQVLVRTGNTLHGADSEAGGAASGDLAQNFPAPHVVALHTSDGQRLPIGTVGDGQLLARSGGALVGQDHVHGIQADPTLHALASEESHGFMPAGAFNKLEGIPSNIDAIARRRVLGLDIRDFVVGNSDLTESNFEEAFLAAKDWAYANVVANANGGWGYDLVVPPGLWHFTGKVQFPAHTAYDRMTPGIRGAGSLRTNFVFPHAINDACIETGSPTIGYTWCQTLQGFSIMHDSPSGFGLGIGIHSYVGYRQTFRDVMVTGFHAPQHHESGIGFKITGSAWGNAQHLYMDRCMAAACQLGYYFNDIWPSTLVDCNANQCTWMDAVIDQCLGMSWHGGNMQSNSAPAWKDTFWHGGVSQPCIATGWTAITDFVGTPFASGSGAVLSAATRDGRDYGTCHVTGLSGLSQADRWRWLVLTDSSYAGPAYVSTDLVSGIYLIEQVLSSTEAIIAKGSTHAPASGLSWQIRGTYGNNGLQVSGYPYHEGVKRALVLALQNHKAAAQYTVRGSLASNLDCVLEAHNVTGSVGVWEPAWRGQQTALRVTGTTFVETDQDLQYVEVDSYSREGLVCRQDGAVGLFQGAYSPMTRFGSFCKERRAIAAWDSRIGVSKTGTDVTAWADFIGGANMVPKNSGHHPQFVASDHYFGGAPSITCLAGTPDPIANPGAGLVSKITAVPARDYNMTLFAVVRIPSQITGERWIFACEATSSSTPTPQNVFSQKTMIMGLADGTYNVNVWGGIYAPSTGFVANGGITVDGLAHAYAVVDPSRASARVGSEVGSDIGIGATSFLSRAGVPLYLAAFDGYYGTRTRDGSIVALAVFPYAMSVSEQRQLLDIAAAEWDLGKPQPRAAGLLQVNNIAETPQTLTGTGSVDVPIASRNDFVIQLTGATTLNLLTFQHGAQGNIWVKQDATGGRTLEWTVAGATSGGSWTAVKDSTLSDLNPTTTANAVTMYAYAMFTAGGVNYVQISKSQLA